MDKFKSFFSNVFTDSNRIKIERVGDALSVMNEAVGVFHQNCTTGIEGYYAGLNNIYNFAERPRKGFSEVNLNITPCLGIKGSIKAFKSLLKENKNISTKKRSDVLENQKNLYDIIGKEIINKKCLKNNQKFIHNRNDDLKEIFETKKVNEKSCYDRWSYAEEILYSLKNKNSKYQKVLGLVGIIIGSWE